ncbi:MAG: glycosyltransferase family 2 protein [Patescibacteria group bacterium]
MFPNKSISIVTPCYNEEENVAEIYSQVKKVMEDCAPNYEHIFIDNASRDKTVAILKEIAAQDKRVKIIVNARNFGSIRSPYYALLQVNGDAAVVIPADLQDPPALIKDFITKWAEGFKVIIGIKDKSEESFLMFAIRKLYYSLLKAIAETEQVKNFNGFALYDRQFIEALKKIDDPEPYLRGLISEFGFSRTEIKYTQAQRKHGKSSNNFYKLYEVAMLGFVNHSKVPLRLASFVGFGLSIVSFIIALVYLVLKLAHWQEFQLGLAPLIIGIFFLGSIQLFFVGILGEYIGAIYTQVKHRPLVIEKERINF